jgi:hypothetical protein
MKLILTAVALAILLGLSMAIPAARNAISQLPWGLLVIACLTIGLAPFAPPHIVEKLHMLADGTLERPIDWFDMLMHGTPWILTLAKALALLLERLGL